MVPIDFGSGSSCSCCCRGGARRTTQTSTPAAVVCTLFLYPRLVIDAVGATVGGGCFLRYPVVVVSVEARSSETGPSQRRRRIRIDCGNSRFAPAQWSLAFVTERVGGRCRAQHCSR